MASIKIKDRKEAGKGGIFFDKEREVPRDKGETGLLGALRAFPSIHTLNFNLQVLRPSRLGKGALISGLRKNKVTGELHIASVQSAVCLKHGAPVT